MIGAAFVLSVTGAYAQQMILLCALPSATISAMFANEAGTYRSEAATSILVSTVLSLVTFSAVIYLIDGAWLALAQCASPYDSPVSRRPCVHRPYDS
jgi:predicted permease